MYVLWVSHLVLAKWLKKPRKNVDIYIYPSEDLFSCPRRHRIKLYNQTSQVLHRVQYDNLPGIWVEKCMWLDSES